MYWFKFVSSDGSLSSYADAFQSAGGTIGQKCSNRSGHTYHHMVAGKNTAKLIPMKVFRIPAINAEGHDVDVAWASWRFKSSTMTTKQKTWKLPLLSLYEENQPVTSVSSHKGPLMRKGFPCHDVFMFIAWWRQDMEIFSALLALCEGIHRLPVDFPHTGPATQSFDVFLCTPEQTVELAVIWKAMTLMWNYFNIWNAPLFVTPVDASPRTFYDYSAFKFHPDNQGQLEPRVLPPQVISRLIPDAKVVIILRNPVTRWAPLSVPHDCCILHKNIVEGIPLPRPSDAYMRPQTTPSLVEIMACAPLAPNHYPKPYRHIIGWSFRTIFSDIWSEMQTFSFKKMNLIMLLAKWYNFVLAWMSKNNLLCDSSASVAIMSANAWYAGYQIFDVSQRNQSIRLVGHGLTLIAAWLSSYIRYKV